MKNVVSCSGRFAKDSLKNLCINDNDLVIVSKNRECWFESSLNYNKSPLPGACCSLENILVKLWFHQFIKSVNSHLKYKLHLTLWYSRHTMCTSWFYCRWLPDEQHICPVLQSVHPVTLNADIGICTWKSCLGVKGLMVYMVHSLLKGEN